MLTKQMKRDRTRVLACPNRESGTGFSRSIGVWRSQVGYYAISTRDNGADAVAQSDPIIPPFGLPKPGREPLKLRVQRLATQF